MNSSLRSFAREFPSLTSLGDEEKQVSALVLKPVYHHSLKDSKASQVRELIPPPAAEAYRLPPKGEGDDMQTLHSVTAPYKQTRE